MKKPRPGKMEKLSSGLVKLDNIFGGGLIPQSATLIAGAPGTGKTTFCLQFLYHGAINSNQPGILVTFEEFPETIYRDALHFGWDLRRLEDEKKLKIIFTSPEILLDEIEKEGGLFDKIMTDFKPELIAFDSISHLRILTSNDETLRNYYNELINSCKRLMLTSLFTYDIAKLFGQENLLDTPIAFIVDNVLYLQYVEIGSQVRTALVAIKIRGSNHSMDICSYEINKNGISILDKFKGRENILSGNSRPILMPD